MRRGRCLHRPGKMHPFLRKSSANSLVPNGSMRASTPTHSREDFHKFRRGGRPCPPAEKTIYTEIFGEFAGSQWVDVGIDPYGPDKDIVGILFDKFIDGLTEAIQGLLVVLLDGVDDAVLDMVLQNHLADIIDGRAHGGDLD